VTKTLREAAMQALPVLESATSFVSKKCRDHHGKTVADLRTALPLREDPQAPIDMVLHCPACGQQHIDAPEFNSQRRDAFPSSTGEDDPALSWTNPPHRSHLCHGCGHIWRPADVPTNGVQEIKTKGSADTPEVERVEGTESACYAVEAIWQFCPELKPREDNKMMLTAAQCEVILRRMGWVSPGERSAPAPVALPETKAWVDSVMEQAQVFASSWSLVGGRFDDGTQHEQALQEKEALRAMLVAVPQRAPVVPPDSVTSILLDVVPGPDGMGVEVYAKTAADVRLKLTEMSRRIEELASNAASAPVAQPQFDATSPEQARLAIAFCLEIAGKRGTRGSLPDPVRLLEMAEALYRAEVLS